MATNLRAALSEHDFENICKEYDFSGKSAEELRAMLQDVEGLVSRD